MTDPNVVKMATEFIDRALEARGQLGYSAKVSKKSYGLAVKRAACVFERLSATNSGHKPRSTGARDD